MRNHKLSFPCAETFILYHLLNYKRISTPGVTGRYALGQSVFVSRHFLHRIRINGNHTVYKNTEH
ncbi:hypothetical protein B5F87_10375 [Eubacterium sp. An3]|nr:hypothetical protein B5F87_10375 [Eubacterium sp. An3]